MEGVWITSRGPRWQALSRLRGVRCTPAPLLHSHHPSTPFSNLVID
jgi:hypothetical protein